MREMTLIVAQIHDSLVRLKDVADLPLGDKEMHFIVMFALGMMLFFVVQFVFTRLAKFSVTAISFVYVFTVMAVLGFAIEVGQRITGTGNMEFGDIAAGLYGVLLFFGIYTAYRAVVLLCRWLWRRAKARR